MIEIRRLFLRCDLILICFTGCYPSNNVKITYFDVYEEMMAKFKAPNRLPKQKRRDFDVKKRTENEPH